MLTKSLCCSRLPPDVAGMIVDHMDVRSILAWRDTCVVNYAHATAALKRTLTAMLNSFLLQPNALLDVISRYGAVIGGETALAFVLRHRPFQPLTLEIFANTSMYRPFCHEVVTDPRIGPDIVEVSLTTTRYPYNVDRDILETTCIHMRSTRTIYVHRSATLSPLSPIARSLCTALVNFVTPHSFGCAYPRLTFDDKSLLSDLRQASMNDLDKDIMRMLSEQQIAVAVDPASWQRYRPWSSTPSVVGSMKACWRSHHICPDQGRFFGDNGSLVDFLDPIGMPVALLEERGSPPFGTAVMWRLFSSYRCPLSCESHDSNLPLGQTSTAVILVDDPFVHPQRERLDSASSRRGVVYRRLSAKVHRNRSVSL